MFDLIAVTALYQCYNIEANRTIQIKITDVRIRSSYDPPYLLIVDSFFGRDKEILGTCFHLHDYYFVVFQGNNIQFVVMLVPVRM